MIFSTNGQAEGQLGVVAVAWGSAVCANSANEVEVGEAGADSTDDFLVDSAVGWLRSGRFNGGNPSESALSLDKNVSLGAVAAGGGEVVGGVGWADVADCSDEEEAVIALASFVSVDFVSAANRVLGIELVAVSVFHVEAENADTFAEDVVVDLVGGATDDVEFGSCGGLVGAIGDELVGVAFGTVTKGHVGVVSGPVDVLVGLPSELVDVIACLTMKQYKQ